MIVYELQWPGQDPVQVIGDTPVANLGMALLSTVYAMNDQEYDYFPSVVAHFCRKYNFARVRDLQVTESVNVVDAVAIDGARRRS